MGMQTDVKSQYASASGLMIPFRTRVKAVFFGVATTTSGVVGLYDNSSIAGTYTRSTTTATVTATNHGLNVGDWAFIDWSGGTNPTDDFYQVATVTNANTFTVTVANTGDASGVATVYNDVLVINTVSASNDVYNIIPGEGILARNGVRVFLENSITATVYYG
jgi:hypothetical protein